MKKAESITQRRQSFKQQLFLDNYRKDGIVGQSATAAGVSRQVVYYWRQTSPSFAKRMQDAENEVHNNILKILCKTARDGNRQMQKFIREEHGENALKSVLRGKNLTLKGMKA